MKFLFWNVHGKKNFEQISVLTLNESIDILLLAEFPEQKIDSTNKLLGELNKKKSSLYCSLDYVADVKINIFCKTKYKKFITLKENTQRDTVIYICIPPIAPILLIASHYQSKVNWSDDDQLAHSGKIKSLVEKWEEILSCDRTILCGDFNMNPFDKGVVCHSGINAVMERDIAMKISRTIENEAYRYFYNPMWGFLGDLGKGKVSGTIRYSPSIPTSYHWQLFDQVFLRPGLIDVFDNDELDIVTQIGSTNLLTASRGIKKKFSDHLPIKFKLKI